MRTIKFRAKDIHDGKWLYGYFKKNSYGDCYIEDEHGLATAVDPETVLQLVCDSEKNGEIYEGDYIQDEEGDLWLIEYDKDSHGFRTVSIGGAMSCSNDSEWLEDSSMNVIGNIWDNEPEDFYEEAEDD